MSAPVSEVLPRDTYEGAGGWNDGRLGQVYDVLHAVLKERDDTPFGHRLLTQIEILDGETPPTTTA